MKVATPSAIEKLIQLIKSALSGKYDKAGGEITGNVKIDGNLTLDIADEDYDSGITFTKALDNNVGTVLTLSGYANASGSNSTYRPVIRNIGDPKSNYDVATKKYVDEQVVRPLSYLVFLNNDGTIDTHSSQLDYSTVKSNLTSLTTNVYLDVIQGSSRFYVQASQDVDVNNGPIVFMGYYTKDGNIVEIEFYLASDNALTHAIRVIEHIGNKVQSVVANSGSSIAYPSAAAIFNEFQRKPVTIWETDGTGLVGLDTNMSNSPNWQLTNLDFSPFKRVKIYTKAAQKSGTTASASTTPAIVLEMSLDPRAAGPYGGHYIGSCMAQKPNDSNRLFTVTCAISADKTSFAVLRMTTLYGTAATSNSDVNAYVFKIEGYYD